MHNAVQRTAPVRGTQSFVYTLSWCWRRPSLIALEILWRWGIGIPALLVAYSHLSRILEQTPLDTIALSQISLLDPVAAASTLSRVVAPLVPPVLHVTSWLAPVVALVWLISSVFGRTAVLRRASPDLAPRPAALLLLHAVRMSALAAFFALWFLLLRADARVTVTAPIAQGLEPNLVLFSAIAIIATLALFTLWAIVSWAVSFAPLLAMQERLGAWQSISAALRLRPLRSKLIEINLVMGIVKIALIVLAMVLSACPLPFESVATPDFMRWWYAGVLVLYFAASDFFHVVHLVAFRDLWEALGRPQK